MHPNTGRGNYNRNQTLSMSHDVNAKHMHMPNAYIAKGRSNPTDLEWQVNSQSSVSLIEHRGKNVSGGVLPRCANRWGCGETYKPQESVRYLLSSTNGYSNDYYILGAIPETVNVDEEEDVSNRPGQIGAQRTGYRIGLVDPQWIKPELYNWIYRALPFPREFVGNDPRVSNSTEEETLSFEPGSVEITDINGNRSIFSMGQTTMGRVRDDINLTLGTNQSLSEQAMESAYLESRDALLRMDVLEQGIEATIRRQENLR